MRAYPGRCEGAKGGNGIRRVVQLYCDETFPRRFHEYLAFILASSGSLPLLLFFFGHYIVHREILTFLSHVTSVQLTTLSYDLLQKRERTISWKRAMFKKQSTRKLMK